MTLPTSGAIALADIQTEFGGTNPISMSEYYAGGSLVPSGTSGTNGAVPSSGAISVSQFYGTTSITINLIDSNLYDDVVSPDVASASYRVDSDGFVYGDVSAGGAEYYQWISNTSQAGNYEILATVTSGAVSSGTTGSWVSVAVDPTWSCFGFGVHTATLSMQIRRIGTSTVLDTWTLVLFAQTGG